MAKKKRRVNQSKKPTGQIAVEEIQPEEKPDSTNEEIDRLVGQWNRLVSTTNWEKGKIICLWREALIGSGASVSDYSDEAWAQLVGGVTGQHVGRLRRVYQRFGETIDQYEGLFWSHFQAAIDWEDAEMWLEGAIHNEWSISQMRGKRWETLGTPPEQQKSELSEAEAGKEGLPDEELYPDSTPSNPPENSSAEKTVGETTSTGKPVDTELRSSEHTEEASDDGAAEEEVVSQPKRTPLNIEVDLLPDDLAEAFEAFKLAIIAHRHGGWIKVSQEQALGCLDALRELTLADE